MELSEILNVLLGGGLAAAVVSVVTIRSSVRKARAEATRALAEADSVRITNTEQATRILVDNIVKPLTIELDETRKEMGSIKREVARLRKAIDGANSCRYHADCPVLDRLRLAQKEREQGKSVGSGLGVSGHGQRDSPGGGQRSSGAPGCGQPGGAPGVLDGVCDGSDVVGDASHTC